MTVYSVWARMASFRSSSFSESCKWTRDTAHGALRGCSVADKLKELVVSGLRGQAVHSCLTGPPETPRASRTYRHGGHGVSDGFHKTQHLQSG